MPQLRPRVSYADLARLPDDGRRFELHGGELVEMASPRYRHQRAVARLVAALSSYEASAGGAVVAAPFDVVMGPYDVLQPDVMYFAPERAARIDEHGVAHEPPDLVVEVLSPGTESLDRGRRMRMFADFGVRELWLVDVDTPAIEQYVLEAGEWRTLEVASHQQPLRSVALPGFDAIPARVCAI